MAKAKRSRKDFIWAILLTVFGVASFPVNPLVLTGVIDAETYLPLYIIGWVTLVGGMVLVMAPIIMFPRRGGVKKGESFVETTKLVDTGIYAFVRHPQYTGGIFAIFLTTLLWYPHWLFGVLGVAGTVVIYLGCREEDKLLVKKFGKDYESYMKRVPQMNFFLGIMRLMKSRN